MKLNYLKLVLVCIAFNFQLKAQTSFEFGIKTSELLLRNFEFNGALKKNKNTYGIFVAFRPSFKNSGEIKSASHGAMGDYSGQNFINKVYTSYTVGVYYKRYIFKETGYFLEGDLYYRNWNLRYKNIYFNNVEGYRFNGLRTENVNVYGLKLFMGRTFILTRNERTFKPYVDLFVGIGVRYRESIYKTYEGYVVDTYYNYKIDRFYECIPSPQAGVRLGFLISTKLRN